MKKLTPFLSLILLASCGEKGNSEKTESGNILENLTYSVDTVMVDPGEELLVLNSDYIGYWSLSSDLTQLENRIRQHFVIQLVTLIVFTIGSQLLTFSRRVCP
jgi:hypothetical protein